jgi:hypothetical protein
MSALPAGECIHVIGVPDSSLLSIEQIALERGEQSGRERV